ncbi:MAG: aldo/keto reductase [Pseudomonadota bacterium]
MQNPPCDLAGLKIPSIGLGCMNLSHAYGPPLPEDEGQALLNRALELGVIHFDTATLYGNGHNEALVGKTIKTQRSRLFLASKCGMTIGDRGRVIDGTPATLGRQIDASLTRLQTDVIDLYYLHRLDPEVPIEDSVGTLGRFVEQGKIRAVGLSEVSAQTLLRAHGEFPVTAVQSEYSPWTRNPELGVLSACREIGAAFVAFSPVGRGFLTACCPRPDELADGDIRRNMPRFQAPHYEKNLSWHAEFTGLAEDSGCTPAQLSLAWTLAQGEHVHVIPGTTRQDHLVDNLGAGSVNLSTDTLRRVGEIVSQANVSGARYGAATQQDIDTEEFESG